MSVPAAPLVTSSVDDTVATLRLDNPAQRNALSPEMSAALAGAVAGALAAGARAIVLTASPPVFCAGGSLDALAARDRPVSDAYVGFDALWDAPVPTVAAVGGPAVGAGVNLPLCCDVVVTSPAARFDPRFLDVGIHPGGGHLWRLARRVGAQGAAALVLMGEVLDGEEAARRGLAWRCVPDDELEAGARALARRAARRDPELVARTKASLRASLATQDVRLAAALELEAQEWSMARPQFDEIVRALKESLSRRERPAS